MEVSLLCFLAVYKRILIQVPSLRILFFFQIVPPLLSDILHLCFQFWRFCSICIHSLPTSSSISSLHLRFGLPPVPLLSLCVHSVVFLTQFLMSILATRPAHWPFAFYAFQITSFTLVWTLIVSFMILSFIVIPSIALSKQRWATANLFFRCFH